MQVRLFKYLTLFGLAFILGSSVLFHMLEYAKNADVVAFLDSLEWSVSTITGTGFSAVAPTTNAGRVLNLFVVFGGTIYIWSYIAVIISSLANRSDESVSQ